MKIRTVGIVLVFVLGTGLLHAAEIVRGRWEKVEALKPGTGIVIRLKAGDRLDGLYRALSADGLFITDASGSELNLPKSSILRVETAEKVRDRLGNGTLIGAGIGAAAGFFSLLGFASYVTNSGPLIDNESAGFYVGAAFVGGGIGAVTGALIDSRIKKTELLYLSR